MLRQTCNERAPAEQSVRITEPRIRLGVLSWTVVGAWLLGMACAFWYFQLRYQRPFASAAITRFDSDSRAHAAADWFRANVAPPASGAAGEIATVVHVYHEDCPCNRFTVPHLALIVAAYASRGVRFVAVRTLAPGERAAAELPRRVELLPGAASAQAPSWIDATPAALVFDGSGNLVYFGPYSNDAWCGVSGGLVERTLDRMLAAKPPEPQPVYARGCFCPWK